MRHSAISPAMIAKKNRSIRYLTRQNIAEIRADLSEQVLSDGGEPGRAPSGLSVSQTGGHRRLIGRPVRQPALFSVPSPLSGFFIVIVHTTCKIYLNLL